MCSTVQAASTAAERKAIAKKERERLKLQERLKKDNLEKLRQEQAASASADDVRSSETPFVDDGSWTLLVGIAQAMPPYNPYLVYMCMVTTRAHIVLQQWKLV